MAESIMLDKAKDFAVEIINICKNIKEYCKNEKIGDKPYVSQSLKILVSGSYSLYSK